MNYLPFVILILVAVALVAFSVRARRRQAAGQIEQAERIEVGTEVMTTSGLYGTVVAKHDDGTVALSIAPGLEVRWELAALRDVASLPPHVGGARQPGVDGADAADEPYAGGPPRGSGASPHVDPDKPDLRKGIGREGEAPA